MMFQKYPYEVDMTRNGSPLVPMLTVCTLQEDIIIMLWILWKLVQCQLSIKNVSSFFSLLLYFLITLIFKLSKLLWRLCSVLEKWSNVNDCLSILFSCNVSIHMAAWLFWVKWRWQEGNQYLYKQNKIYKRLWSILLFPIGYHSVIPMHASLTCWLMPLRFLFMTIILLHDFYTCFDLLYRDYYTPNNIVAVFPNLNWCLWEVDLKNHTIVTRSDKDVHSFI
jgi:hypothetical protein